MRMNIKIGMFVLTAMMTGNTQASEGYLGLSLGQSTFLNYEGPARSTGNPPIPVSGAEMDTAMAGKLYGGYRFDAFILPLPVLIEAGYLDAGHHSLNDSAGNFGKLNFRAVMLSLGVVPYQNADLGLTTWAKAGYYNGDAGITTNVGFPGGVQLATTQKSTGVQMGFGGLLRINPWFGFTLDLDLLLDAKTGSTDQGSNLLLVTAGLQFAQPSPQMRAAAPVLAPQPSAAAPPAALPTPPPVAQVSAPEAAAAADSESAPPVASAPVSVTRTRIASFMRRQPTLQLMGASPIPAGTPVRPVHKISNTTGVWWFVESTFDTGWMRESELLLAQ